MKQKKLLAFAVASMVCFCGAEAQAAASNGRALATIQTPASITVTATDNDLNFGTITPSGTAGSVTVTTAGSGSAADANCSLDATACSEGSFTITGTAGKNMAITLPQDTANITVSNGEYSMGVTGFKGKLDSGAEFSASGGAATGSLASSEGTLHVGATLAVGANQQGGSYSGTYSVTVAYN